VPMSFYPSLLHFPEFLMRDRRLTWELTAPAMSGGRTLSGVAPAARLDGGGLWMCTMQDVQVSSSDHVRTWRALASILDGGATPVVLTVRDKRFAPWPGSQTDQYSSENSDGSTCSDGSPYVNDVIDAEIFAAAGVRDTQLIVNMNNGAALSGGEYFSIEHDTFSHRLYSVGALAKLDTYTPKMSEITVTIASPGVFTWTNHGLVANQRVHLTTFGSLPTGLAARTAYYVVGASITTNTVQLSATPAGIAINTSGSQSGRHRAHAGGIHTVTMRPPLREAVVAGCRVEFDYPKCAVKLATPDAMSLALERRFHGQANVKFIESFPPWT
jgi:hypothetical protein